MLLVVCHGWRGKLKKARSNVRRRPQHGPTFQGQQKISGGEHGERGGRVVGEGELERLVAQHDDIRKKGRLDCGGAGGCGIRDWGVV